MTCLISALITKSSAIRIRDAHSATDVIDNKPLGLEMGTWNFPSYLSYFKKLVNTPPDTYKREINTETIGPFTYYCVIPQEVKDAVVVDINHKLKYKKYHVMKGAIKQEKFIKLNPVKNSFDNLVLKERWAIRLRDIMAANEPVYFVGD